MLKTANRENELKPHIRYSSIQFQSKQGFHCQSHSKELIITPKFLKDITGKCNLHVLTNLNLQFKDDRFPKIRRISGMEVVPNLISLNLSYNELTKIEGLFCLSNLTCLNLSENHITITENLVFSPYNENIGKINKIREA